MIFKTLRILKSISSNLKHFLDEANEFSIRNINFKLTLPLNTKKTTTKKPTNKIDKRKKKATNEIPDRNIFGDFSHISGFFFLKKPKKERFKKHYMKIRNISGC